jgi:hypothetical protein
MGRNLFGHLTVKPAQDPDGIMEGAVLVGLGEFWWVR